MIAFLQFRPVFLGAATDWGSALLHLVGCSGGTVGVVGDDENEALDRLPFPYAEALRLRAAGVADEVIAEVLGIESDAVGPLLRMAEAKLAAVRGRDQR